MNKIRSTTIDDVVQNYPDDMLEENLVQGSPCEICSWAERCEQTCLFPNPEELRLK